MDKQTKDILVEVFGEMILKYDESFLLNTLRKRLQGSGNLLPDEYLAYLLKDKKEEKAFCDSLQIGYSEFFRNSLTYPVLERLILPMIIMNKIKGRKKMIRVWSAACASGQEPYSLAILLEEMKPEIEGNCHYMIFSTDQDASAVDRARQGSYKPEAMENVSLKRAGKWFFKEGRNFNVIPELKKNISFSVFDLLDDSLASPTEGIFGNFDLIVCANLLFYYKEPFREAIVNKLSGALSDKGYLVTGDAERDILARYNFREIYPHSAIFIKKPSHEDKRY